LEKKAQIGFHNGVQHPSGREAKEKRERPKLGGGKECVRVGTGFRDSKNRGGTCCRKKGKGARTGER